MCPAGVGLEKIVLAAMAESTQQDCRTQQAWSIQPIEKEAELKRKRHITPFY